ncbi:TadE family protein [Mesorhizobium sp. M00.F.Ca.ET.216.01.1.1]|uniref:TadE/TadG family type IV pilus assembly protein n=1 Tax=Mesorhizobium sp. M00.F.Ca.ET.216.01.1.1 TaxID=2500528 RepID=UPI000FD8B90A|nr:TadE family protein [Mesorhizobium sp. M00.F.Ca.ET.216.01.1.1]TGQ31062.1 pilus assembly protein [Mesorhizobium sp. M00.F.Ca.ET.216.01.1.1]TJW04593.1 MAG: pilus assembly protein [Mesorhizobium sp.]
MGATMTLKRHGPLRGLAPRSWTGVGLDLLRQKFRDWRRSEEGVSAVEFALIAPVLGAALIAAVDVGLALYQRMTIDHVLRAGAQAAMSDPGADQVLKVLQSTASKNFPPVGAEPSALTFDPPPVRYCACPENANVDPAAAPLCSTTCANSAPTFIYYRMAAQKTYDSMFIPEFPLSSTMQVQIR